MKYYILLVQFGTVGPPTKWRDGRTRGRPSPRSSTLAADWFFRPGDCFFKSSAKYWLQSSISCPNTLVSSLASSAQLWQPVRQNAVAFFPFVSGRFGRPASLGLAGPAFGGPAIPAEVEGQVLALDWYVPGSMRWRAKLK